MGTAARGWGAGTVGSGYGGRRVRPLALANRGSDDPPRIERAAALGATLPRRRAQQGTAETHLDDGPPGDVAYAHGAANRRSERFRQQNRRQAARIAIAGV